MSNDWLTVRHQCKIMEHKHVTESWYVFYKLFESLCKIVMILNSFEYKDYTLIKDL